MNRESHILKHVSLVEVLAVKMAKKVPLSVDVRDLVGYGYVGLIQSVDRFDETKGVDFVGYASSRIKGAIIDGLRKMSWKSRSMLKNESRATKFQLLMEKDAIDAGLIETDFELREQLSMINEALLKLPEQEKLAAQLIFKDGCKQIEVSRILKVSESRVSHIKKHLISNMRELLGGQK